MQKIPEMVNEKPTAVTVSVSFSLEGEISGDSIQGRLTTLYKLMRITLQKGVKVTSAIHTPVVWQGRGGLEHLGWLGVAPPRYLCLGPFSSWSCF